MISSNYAVNRSKSVLKCEIREIIQILRNHFSSKNWLEMLWNAVFSPLYAIHRSKSREEMRIMQYQKKWYFSKNWFEMFSQCQKLRLKCSRTSRNGSKDKILILALFLTSTFQKWPLKRSRTSRNGSKDQTHDFGAFSNKYFPKMAFKTL